MSVTSFDPTNVDQRLAFPGNFAGVVDGQEQPFKSFGFMNVTVQQNGVDLNIGSTAEIEIPIPASQVNSAPNTIDAWYFNTEQGKWIKDGVFTKVDKGGGVYVYRKDVTHFSTWNADYLYQEAFKKGKVVDRNGNPVANAMVIVEGDGWRNETITDSNGEYILAVEPNATITEWARKGTLSSSRVIETTGATNETKTVADIVLDDPLATITLVWGANPRDLDSHLTGPTPEGQTARFHCYYRRKDPMGSNASLDIDYTFGYGPEHIVITRFKEGIYRYAIHHYAGSGTIATSGAQVRLDIPSKGIISQIFTPPTNQPTTLEGDAVWRVFDLVVDSAGNVTVRPLGDYASYSDPENAFLTTPGAFSVFSAKKSSF